MNATTRLLGHYRENLGIKSDNAAAKSLDIKRQTINNWRKRGSQAEPHLIARMCDAIGEDPASWLLQVMCEQSRLDANRRVWQRLSQRFGLGVVTVLTMVAGEIMAPDGLVSMVML